LTDLEDSINHLDVTTLKPFRQSACLDPVAQQILTISRIGKMESSSGSLPNSRPPSRNRFTPRRESYASHLQPQGKGGSARGKGGNRHGNRPPSAHGNGNRPPPSPDALAKLESISALPQRDGRMDMDAYSKYKVEGLRRKIHDAIRAKKCIRCFKEGHLRSSSCPERRTKVLGRRF
jgi:hypothetical protein